MEKELIRIPKRENIIWFHLFYRWLVLSFITLLYFLGVYENLGIYSSIELKRIGYLIVFTFLYNALMTSSRRFLDEKIDKFPSFFVSLDALVCFALMALTNGWRSPFFFYSFSPILVAAFVRGYLGGILAAFQMIFLFNLALYVNHSFLEIIKGNLLETYIANDFAYLLIGVFFAVPSVLAKRLKESNKMLKAYQKERQAQATMEAITKERNRIALEMHDSVVQILSGAGLILDFCLKKLALSPQGVSNKLQDVRALLSEGLKNVRYSIFNLRPPDLEAGLIPFFKRYTHEFSRANSLAVSFDVEGEEKPLATEAERSVYRVLQEALANTLKHAQASQIGVKLNFGQKEFSLAVEDNGQGFNVQDALARAEEGKALGLLSMREAIENTKGKFQIESTPQLGTKILLSLPL